MNQHHAKVAEGRKGNDGELFTHRSRLTWERRHLAGENGHSPADASRVAQTSPHNPQLLRPLCSLRFLLFKVRLQAAAELPKTGQIVDGGSGTAECYSVIAECKRMNAGSSGLYEVKQSPIHGYGVFARAPIAPETKIIEYIGEQVSKAESLRRRQDGNLFVFIVNDDFDIDGSVDWNPARFINHSCTPNCEAHMEEDRIWIVAKRDIAPGEELSFNYGYDLQDYEEHPCHCGSPNCIGFMVAEEHFDDVRRSEAKRKR